MQTVIFLMGPTASGKTDLACQLSQHLPIDLISVDSAMIYRGMDIGTAKPSEFELQRYPHALIDIKDPAERYSVGEFCQDAKRLIEASFAKDRIPLLVGGTMLYFNALQQGLSDLPLANETVRAHLSAEAAAKGWGALHQRLQQVDPMAAAKIHVNDPQRIQRALEVYELSGQPLSNFWAKREGLPYPITALALAPSDKSVLHERIAQRFHLMLEQGFLQEAAQLYQRCDLHADLPSIRSVGYRQAWDYLKGEVSKEEMTEQAIAATRGLAKRQLTWLKAWPQLHWLESESPNLWDKALVLLRG